MTTCFHIVKQLQVQALSPRCSELFTVTRHVVPLICAQWAKSVIVDCLVNTGRVACLIDIARLA